MGRGSQLTKKKGVSTPGQGQGLLTQVEEFKYVRVLFMSDDKSGAGHRPTDWCEDKALTSPMVTSLWVVTEIMRSQIQAARINFLQRVAGLSQDRVRSH